MIGFLVIMITVAIMGIGALIFFKYKERHS